MSVSSLAIDRTVDEDADDGAAIRIGEPPRPSYGPVLAVYLAFVGAVAVAVRAVTGRRPPQPSVGDLVMIGAAVFKVSRIVTEEKVLQPVREPFISEDTTPAGRREHAPATDGRGSEGDRRAADVPVLLVGVDRDGVHRPLRRGAASRPTGQRWPEHRRHLRLRAMPLHEAAAQLRRLNVQCVPRPRHLKPAQLLAARSLAPVPNPS